MNLPVNPPVLPMLAKRIDQLPSGNACIFEPKWDGFRALVFRDRDETLIQSRDSKSLNRYFPELLEALKVQLPSRCVLDGEIVVAKNDGLDFEELQLRIHPAASRVKLLSHESPASSSNGLDVRRKSGIIPFRGRNYRAIRTHRYRQRQRLYFDVLKVDLEALHRNASRALRSSCCGPGLVIIL